jgi:hypothetical protein
MPRKRLLAAPTFAFAADDGWLRLTLPVRTVSEANARGKWQQINRKAQQRKIVRAWLGKGRPYHNRLPSPPALVRLVRIGPKPLDEGDNLPSALKAVRDEVAAAYGLGDGADAPLEWDYQQRPGSREYAVEIQVYRPELAPVFEQSAL